MSLSNSTQFRRSGSALLLAVLLLALLSTLIFAFANTLAQARSQSRSSLDQTNLDRAAENAITLAVHRLWQPFEQERADKEVTTQYEVRQYLERLGITDQSQAAVPARTNVLELLGVEHLNSLSSNQAKRTTNIDQISVYRLDQGRDTALHFRVDTSARRGEAVEGVASFPALSSFEAVYEVGPENWDGLNYALLANNVNCAMCHMNVDDANRFWNKDESQYGTYSRVKVASLESFHLRERANSHINGTLYLGAKGYDEHGLEITDWPSETIDSAAMDGAGHLAQDQWGQLGYEDLHAALPTAGELQPFENLYLNYLDPSAASVDGYLPTEFPAIFPDNGGIDQTTGEPIDVGQGNRVIDAAEFYAATLYSNGTISGGHRNVTAPGSSVRTASELESMRSDSNVGQIAGHASGSVYLRGTADNPILLDGEVAIDGDLIMHGFVKGQGTLKVSGNVYIPDSLIYLDGADENGNRAFGVSADGTANALAIGAGGNVLVGDVFRPRWGNGFTTGDDDGSFSFVMENLSTFNRREWTKTQDVLPGAGESLDHPESWTETNPLYQGSDYIARYYQFTPDSPIPISKGGHFDSNIRSWVDNDLANSWDNVWKANPNDLNDPLIGHGAHPTRPVTAQITATDDWISTDQLRSLIEDQLASQPSNRYVVVDGTFYSNNSIFGIIGARNATGTLGKLALEGAVVAADVGLLAPVDLRIHYDRRGKDLLDIISTGKMSIRNVLWHRVGTATP